MKRTPYLWRWWTVVLRGVAAILFGLLSLFVPGAAFLSLVLLFGIYAVVDGVLALSLGFREATYPRGAMVVRGFVSIAAGLIALFWPRITALVLLLVIASWAIVSGVLEIAMAVRMRKQLEHEWLLGIEGGISIGFGVLLILAPLAGVIVLGLWVGAYALVIGGMLVGTGLRLRSYLLAHPTQAAAAA
jgi:uncharacterized membrane protein HdeD (DUF308 family)